MRCRDGIRLACRIWRPEGLGPWPVLLMRQPYGRAIASTVTYAHPSWYARHGFQVVVQDVRGRGASEGEFQGFRQEAADGADSFRWARGLEGSNGQLGCYGFSYQGLTQLLSDDEDALPDCLAPAMAGLDEKSDWASEGGAHWWGLGLAWGLQLAAQSCQRLGDDHGWQAIRRSLETGQFLHEGLTLLERHDPQGMALGWLQRSTEPAAAWVRHQPSPVLLRRPMLLIGGWYDPHLRGILDLWDRAKAAGGAPLLRIGAWTHLDWQGGLDRLQLAFFQQHLQQRSAPVELHQPVLLEDATTHLWQAPTEAPVPLSWGLVSGGLAAIDADEGELLAEQAGGGSVTLVHDPWRPVPGRGGHLGLDPGPCKRRDLDRRSDVACFTSPPLGRGLSLEGRPLLRIRVIADQPSFDLCACLSRVNREGTEVDQFATGVARIQGSPGQAMLLELEFQPLLASLEIGDRVRLALAGSAWPQIAVNPGDGSLPNGPAGPQHRVISLDLDLAESQLQILPLLRGKVGAN
ncbi:CocE/NonD family hydrolase [Cyanobium sp. Alchichica 3B3-8F6]|nr:CocE/NonD family hydrolase [Cyanobium sp. Alchichica 3B3-8F6]